MDIENMVADANIIKNNCQHRYECQSCNACNSVYDIEKSLTTMKNELEIIKRFTLPDIIIDTADYLELIGENRKYITMQQLEEMKLDYWDYPLSEIIHCAENNIEVVIVRFDNDSGGYDYRLCQIS